MGSEKGIVPIESERENFGLSGPSHLTTVDWSNPSHRQSVAACLVQSVYILEHDREKRRQGVNALAPPWYETFDFRLYKPLIDNTDDKSLFGDTGESLFGAIFQLKSPTPNDFAPRYVIAFRGTIIFKVRDLKLNIKLGINRLHQASCFETAIQEVRDATFGSSNVWIAGHSLGAAISLLVGKNMAKSGVFLDAYLFNPPFLSAPIEKIKNKKVKHGLRFAKSVITAGLAKISRSGSGFDSLSTWLPCLFVNPADHICSGYVGYFEHRKWMEKIGAGNIERLATQHSMMRLLLNVKCRPSEEPLHLIPSANLTVNPTPAPDFMDAHGIRQWWRSRDDLKLETITYNY